MEDKFKAGYFVNSDKLGIGIVKDVMPGLGIDIKFNNKNYFTFVSVAGNVYKTLERFYYNGN